MYKQQMINPSTQPCHCPWRIGKALRFLACPLALNIGFPSLMSSKALATLLNAALFVLFFGGAEALAAETPVFVYEVTGFFYGNIEIKLEIFENGKIHYFGKGGHIYTQGHRYAKISRQTVQKLIDTFIAEGFFELPSKHYASRDGVMVDAVERKTTANLPKRKITVNLPNRSKPFEPTFGEERFISLISVLVDLESWACYPPEYNKPEYCYQ